MIPAIGVKLSPFQRGLAMKCVRLSDCRVSFGLDVEPADDIKGSTKCGAIWVLGVSINEDETAFQPDPAKIVIETVKPVVGVKVVNQGFFRVFAAVTADATVRHKVRLNARRTARGSVRFEVFEHRRSGQVETRDGLPARAFRSPASILSLCPRQSR